jgi:uncharacterized membrane protein YfcA
MNGKLFLFGAVAGVGALASNWLARRFLREMRARDFRAIVVGFMALSGAVMIWRQRDAIIGLF